MLLIAFLYYENEKRLYFDLTKTKMQNIVSNISSKLIFAHMNNEEIDFSQFLKTDMYKISFYNGYKNKIFGNLDDDISFDKKIIRHENHFILVDESTYGHKGVFFIAIEENLYFKTIKKLQLDIIIFFLLVYSIISLIGFYLAKLFLRPIKNERERLNDFIKDTTHELNTPISAILMSSESEDLSKKQIERIKLSAKRVSEIYKDLTFIFLEDIEKRQEVKSLNITKTIEEQLKYFEILAQKKRITIDKNLEEFFFKIDENDFVRLFNNILSNAIKYNKQKGSVEIKLQNNQLLIKDTGIGIEQSRVKDIFKRYFRATHEHGGFGIGLNIVQKICDKYSIKVDVQSKLKEGTTFIFYFD